MGDKGYERQIRWTSPEGSFVLAHSPSFKLQSSGIQQQETPQSEKRPDLQAEENWIIWFIPGSTGIMVRLDHLKVFSNLNDSPILLHRQQVGPTLPSSHSWVWRTMRI